MRQTTAEAFEPPPAPLGPVFASVRLPAAAGVAHLRLTGELELVTAVRARGALRAAQDESEILICDLGDLWFIDLSGLRLLLDTAARARSTGRRLIIANAPTMLPRLLRVLELDGALEVAGPPLAAAPDRRCDAVRPHVS